MLYGTVSCIYYVSIKNTHGTISRIGNNTNLITIEHRPIKERTAHITLSMDHGLTYNGLETKWSAGVGGRPRKGVALSLS